MKKILLALMFLFASIAPGEAEVHQQGVVYVVFERTGENAVKADDVNQNSVPDVVEDIAIQINAAREVFHDVCGFPDPFKSPRYPNIGTIEVHVLAKANMGNSNGLAYSGKWTSKDGSGKRALHIKVAAVVDPRKNSTPAPEYFHLIQYGATYFRNSWYLEGMARWSQDSIHAVKKYPTVKSMYMTLNSRLSKAAIFSERYKAANLLWYPLAVECKDKTEIPSSVMKKYRYADGTPVFQDDIFYGANVMNKVLAAMHEKEAVAAAGYADQKTWRKDGVRSDENNELILECVREVYENY